MPDETKSPEPSPLIEPFVVDVASNDDNRFYVDVAGYGTVCIMTNGDGLAVDVFSPHVDADGAIASCWAPMADFMAKEEPYHAG